MKCPACKEGTLKIGVYQSKTGAYRGESVRVHLYVTSVDTRRYLDEVCIWKTSK